MSPLCTGESWADHSYPRLANIYFPTLVGADLEHLARWDVLVLATRADEWYRAELAELRRLNPDITLLVHMPVGYHGDWSAPSIEGDLRSELYAHDWWVRDTSGQKFVLPDGDGLLNVTTWCPRDEQGRRLCDWLPEYIAQRLGPGGAWDGVYLDFCMEGISWANTYSPRPMDADNDHAPDGAGAVDAAWAAGMRRVVDRLRELVGDEYIIVTNGNNTFWDACNGGTREDFPNMHGGWYENVMSPGYGYASAHANYADPTVNIVNGMWAGPVGPSGPEANPAFDRQLRFALATTLVYGNGYFSFDGGAGLSPHCQAWWHPLYDLDLGEPVGRPVQPEAEPGGRGGIEHADLLRARRFEHGMALVNPTPSTQAVSLGGTYHLPSFWNGRFFAHEGAVQGIELAARSGDVLAGCGRGLAGVAVIRHVSRGAHRIAVAWDPVPGAVLYSVYRSCHEGEGRFGPTTLVDVVDAPGYADHAIEERRVYRYAVAAIDEHHCEWQLSRPVEVSTEPGNDLFIDTMVGPLGGQLPHVPDAPDSLMLGAVAAVAFPNPARGGTTVSFAVRDAGGGSVARVRLTVCDAAGRVVRRLVDVPLPPGRHEAFWDGSDERGRPVASGCYLLSLALGGRTSVGKVLLIR